jgi:carbon storage regulator CsrA
MALVLTQRIQDGPFHFEDINTGEHIEVNVIGVSGGQVRIAIKASDNIEVQRDVIYRKIQEEKGGNR